MLKSPRPTLPSHARTLTTPRGSGSIRPQQSCGENERVSAAKGGSSRKKPSRAPVTPLPTLPVDSHVTPASLAEQRQRDKFYAYYYQSQQYQQQQQRYAVSPHSHQYSPYYHQYGGYWPGYDYSGRSVYSYGPPVATAISSKTKRTKAAIAGYGASTRRVPTSPAPRPPDVIAAKIQSAVQLSRKKRGNDLISKDIMDAGIPEEKSSARIAARTAAKKAKPNPCAATDDAAAAASSNVTTKKVLMAKKSTKNKKSSPAIKAVPGMNKTKAKSKGKTAAAAARAGPQVGEKGYKRADKSLGLLCERFVNHYKDSHGVEIAVDDAATDLGVERRRIYDIINILEALRVVRRICKNTYTWHGSEVLPLIFASMQQDAIVKWRDQAVANGLVDASSSSDKRSRSNSDTCDTCGKSMATLTCDFVKLFLAGDTTITVTEAADRVLGTNSELYTEGKVQTEEQKAEAKVMKSKIRRLYDIANVLSSIKVIDKENCGASFQKNNETVPQFRWVYAIPPKAFLQVRKDHGHLIPADPDDDDPVINVTPYASKGHKTKRKTKGNGKSPDKSPRSSQKRTKAKKNKK